MRYNKFIKKLEEKVNLINFTLEDSDLEHTWSNTIIDKEAELTSLNYIISNHRYNNEYKHLNKKAYKFSTEINLLKLNEYLEGFTKCEIKYETDKHTVLWFEPQDIYILFEKNIINFEYYEVKLKNGEYIYKKIK